MQKKYFSSQDARSLINTYGFALFPIHGIDENGNCTCGKASCTNAGKHPATTDGFKSATNNIDDLLKLWNKRQHLNVGVATGKMSNIFVIDIDSKEGEEKLYGLGEIPNTLTVSTSKGKHLYFKYPNEDVITKKGIIEGVDVRGDGGYVAGVGSNHASGFVYSFDNLLEDIVEAPDFILDLVVKSRIPRKTHELNILTTHAPILNLNQGWSEDDVRDMLDHISPDIGYDEWIQVGMAIHAEGLGFHLWDEWSKRGSKYDGSTGLHWKSFKPSGGTSFGTVVHMAKEGGWKPKSSSTNDWLPDVGKSKHNKETGEIIDEQVEPVVEQVTPTRTIQWIHSNDIIKSLEAKDFVKGVLGEAGVSVTYGESNCGKTFYMTDLAFHVALGREWNGLRVDQGGVIYVALEGAYGLRNRIAAFKQENMIEDMPLVVIPSPIDFMNPKGNINEFIEVIKEIKEEIGDVKLIVIDTLARAMTGGDENSSQDMSIIIHHADRIRIATDTHVNFVHHSGKDASKGARGSGALRGAIDTEICITRDQGAKYATVTVVKQKDMEKGEDSHFMLRQVVLGKNQYREDVTSCVVVPVDSPEEIAKPVRLNSNEEFVYDALIEALIKHGEVKQVGREGRFKCVDYIRLHTLLEDRGSKDLYKKNGDSNVKAVTEAARKSLKYKGKINFNRNYLWMIGDYTLEGEE